jgi:hypothetical protein
LMYALSTLTSALLTALAFVFFAFCIFLSFIVC